MDKRRLALMASLAMLAGFIPSAHAAGLVITGTVRDALGSPLAGASVTDGRRTVATDGQGGYVLVETSPDTYAVRASKDGYVTQTKFVNTLTNTSDVDFNLLFKLNPKITPTYFNAVPTTLSLEATSLAPSNTAISATLPDSSSVVLAYESQVGTLNRWTGTHTVPTGTADGTYRVTFAGKVSGSNVTDVVSYSYVLDRVPVALSGPRASPNGTDPVASRSATPTLSVAATDDRSGVDSTSVSAEIKDATGTVVSGGAGTFASNRASYQVPPSNALRDGRYLATFQVNDKAGNSTSVTFSFVVDTKPPLARFGYPEDDVYSTTPEIGATATDSGPAALDAPSLSIDNGPVVASYFDPNTRRLTYRAVVPLAPGKHQATVVAKDSAGNSDILRFDFWVLETLLYDRLSGTYIPTPASQCNSANTSLLSLFNGRAVSAHQISHGERQSASADLVARWIFADTLSFTWSPTLGGNFMHEVIADGIPLDVSGGNGSGVQCAPPPDPHSSEIMTHATTSYDRGQFGPGGNPTKLGQPVASGTYAWRVKDAAAAHSTETDRLTVLSTVAKWPSATQDYFLSSSLGPEWQSVIRTAAERWTADTSSFTYRYVGSCSLPPSDCDAVNYVRKRSMGANGPVAFTEYRISEIGTEGPDAFACCFRITINEAAPISASASPLYGTYNLFTIAMHELGHGAGLGHDFNYPASVMNNVVGYQWRRSSLMPFDRNTLRYLYP